MRFVSIKQPFHQDLQMSHRIRERLIKNRTVLCNEVREFLLEYGIEIKRGKSILFKEFPAILENTQSLLTLIGQSKIYELYEELKVLEKRVEDYSKKIELQASSNDDCKRLQNLRGVGLIVATTIVASTPDPNVFKNGRDYAAWLGVVPKQYSSGDKNILLGICKRGNSYVRKQLIYGCRSTVYRATSEGDNTAMGNSNKRAKR